MVTTNQCIRRLPAGGAALSLGDVQAQPDRDAAPLADLPLVPTLADHSGAQT